jgi:zinc protease
MNRTLIAALAALALTPPLAAQSAAPTAAPAPSSTSAALQAWSQTGSDIAVDPAVRFGVLPNGMKYALMRNTTPREEVAVRLHFNIGSLAEEEDQRGLAHFLEHMAFNGSANVPEGEMNRILERNGLAFGADTNAVTSFDETSYRLDLPRNTPELIDTALMLMREISGNLTLAPDAIDRERGVILAERAARDNYGLRDTIDMLAFSYPGARLNSRLPIGLEEVIRTAPAARLRAFYDQWYRPERATLVIVGDIDVDAVEAGIRARFADWQGRGAGGEDPEYGPFTHDRPAGADIYVHPALAETVSIMWTRADQLRPATIARRHRYQLEGMAEAIIRRRLTTLAQAADAPFLNASVSEQGGFDDMRTLQAFVTARDGRWAAAMRVVENELRRAIEHGFTDAEVAEQVASRRTAYRNAASGAATRRTGGLAGELMGLIDTDGAAIFSTPATDLAIAEPVFASANGESVTAAFRAMVQGFGAPQIRVTAKAEITGGTQAILAAYDSATRLAVAPPAVRETQQFAYTDFGTPGRVVSDNRVEDLAIRRVRFANNVMLNIRRTDFQADRVSVWVRLDGGSLLTPPDDPTRYTLAGILTLGGLEAHSNDDLRSILAGRSVSAGFTVGTDSFNQSGSTIPDSLLLQLQLYAATIRHPGYRPEAIALFRRAIPQQYAGADATPGAVIGRQVPPILANDNPLLVIPPLEAMLALEWEPLRALMADPLTNGAIEIGIVGDVDEDAAIAAVAQTFGALPTRRATFAPQTEARVRTFASDLTPRTLYHRGERDQAVVLAYWPARDDSDLRETLELDLLAAVMRLRLLDELRERLGRSYSPSASADLSSDFPGYGTLFAGGQVGFGDVAVTEAAIAEIVAGLRDAAISDDVLTRARTPILERLEASRRENGYWLNYAAHATSDPARLDRSRQALGLLTAITPADIQRAAQRYLRDDRQLRIRVVSREAAGLDPPVAGASAPMSAPAPAPAE